MQYLHFSDYAKAREVLVTQFGHPGSVWPEDPFRLEKCTSCQIMQGFSVSEDGRLIVRLQVTNNEEATKCLEYIQSGNGHRLVRTEILKPDPIIENSDRLESYHNIHDIASPRVKRFINHGIF